MHYPQGNPAADAGLTSLNPAAAAASQHPAGHHLLFTAPNPQGGVDVVECIDVAPEELG